MDTGSYLAVIKVVGIGGGGTNAVNRMVDAGLKGVEFIAVNTDAQALQMCDADIKLQIGDQLTRGLGAGANPDVGYGAANESRDEIKEALKGADMVFVTAGEGGGTGTGAAPGDRRGRQAGGGRAHRGRRSPSRSTSRARSACARPMDGIERLREQVDTLIVIPNEKLLAVVERRTSILDAFREADNVLRQGVQGITDLITIPGLINLDFADVRTIMHDAGSALMGIGEAGGREPRGRGGQERDLQPAARAVGGGRHGHPAEHHRRQRPRPVRGQRGRGDHPERRGLRTRTSSSAPWSTTRIGDGVRVTVIATGFERAGRRLPLFSRGLHAAAGASRGAATCPWTTASASRWRSRTTRSTFRRS